MFKVDFDTKANRFFAAWDRGGPYSSERDARQAAEIENLRLRCALVGSEPYKVGA
jgi:hypothetical protein